jgi:hypothetical protein
MNLIISLGALSVIAATIWLSADALGQSGNISFPATLVAAKDFVDR